ncbi:MAG: GntR family transcriptional regulator [Proteobacteria bacterium]|nr:GntR family transcriptional regulator [Pseudomonadota bacterium]
MTAAVNYKPRPSLHVRKQSLTDKAYSAIKAEIISGRIQFDKFIDLKEVETQLGISRTPVREAMLRLQNENIVEIVPKRGIRILPLSVVDLKEYYQVITALEVQAVSMVVDRKLPRTDIMPVLYALSSLEISIKGQDQDAWALADENYHRGLFILSGSKKLTDAGLFYRDIVQRAHFVALSHVSMTEKARCLRNRNELKGLLLSGNGAQARKDFREQCDWEYDMIINALEKLELTSI